MLAAWISNDENFARKDMMAHSSRENIPAAKTPTGKMLSGRETTRRQHANAEDYLLPDSRVQIGQQRGPPVNHQRFEDSSQGQDMLRLAVATEEETYERMQSPLERRGIDAQYIQTAERTIPLSRGTENYIPADQGSTNFDVGFVFPPRLAEGGIAAGLLDVPWVNDRETVLRSRHKGETLARLGRHDVPTPDTVVVSNEAPEDELVSAFRAFEPPVVIKPNNTTRGIGVAKATDLDSFLGICDYLDLVHDYRATGDRSFLVQEFLPDARDFRLMVVDGAVVGAVERRLPDSALAVGQWKHNVHRGAQASPINPGEDLRELATATAEALDIPWLGIDVLVTGDRAVVNETNARPTIDEASKYDDGFWDELAALIRSQL